MYWLQLRFIYEKSNRLTLCVTNLPFIQSHIPDILLEMWRGFNDGRLYGKLDLYVDLSFGQKWILASFES